MSELILKEKEYAQTEKKMNYKNYERKIVEELGVALIGWPGDGTVENPGTISMDKGTALRNALKKKECQWVKLTSEQLETRKSQNAQRAEDAEKVYGPPRKKRAKRNAHENQGVEDEE